MKSGSDAIEYKLQDYFYCKNQWLDKDNRPKPPITDGYSEWFGIDVNTARTQMMQFFNDQVPAVQTGLHQQN